MSANRIFLVCSHCPKLEHALVIADRADGNSQYTAASVKRADDWYARHQRCGPGVDHYQLAYHRPIDWDVSPPAQDTPAGAVRMALAQTDPLKCAHLECEKQPARQSYFCDEHYGEALINGSGS